MLGLRNNVVSRTYIDCDYTRRLSAQDKTWLRGALSKFYFGQVGVKGSNRVADACRRDFLSCGQRCEGFVSEEDSLVPVAFVETLPDSEPTALDLVLSQEEKMLSDLILSEIAIRKMTKKQKVEFGKILTAGFIAGGLDGALSVLAAYERQEARKAAMRASETVKGDLQ